MRPTSHDRLEATYIERRYRQRRKTNIGRWVVFFFLMAAGTFWLCYEMGEKVAYKAIIATER